MKFCSARCQSPYSLSGKRIAELKKKDFKCTGIIIIFLLLLIIPTGQKSKFKVIVLLFSQLMIRKQNGREIIVLPQSIFNPDFIHTASHYSTFRYLTNCQSKVVRLKFIFTYFKVSLFKSKFEIWILFFLNA